jgi:CubicO group peptidase (beta-lactamase class C family)
VTEPKADPRQALFELLEEGARTGVFPGAVALVWRAGAVLYDEAHGTLATHPSSSVKDIETTRDTIFDLASLTKVLGTTTIAAQLVSEGVLSLDAEVPEPWRHACEGATLAHLLEHSSGLASHRDYFTMVEPFDAEKVLHHVISTPRAYPIGAQAIYSDLGFMILGAWLERVLERPLDEAFADRVAYRLGLDDHVLPAIGYRRLFSTSALRWELERRIAPTEVYDRALHPEGIPSYLPVREATSVAHGAVHDDNAWVMGGVAGHAGLFGTAAAVLEIARAWCEGILPGLDPRVRDRFWQASAVPGSTRRLGWDGTPADGSGSTGHAMTDAAVGHTGFTGTSVWVDPASEEGPWIAVLLTNRVHPVRTDDRIKTFRPRFHELAARLR